MELRGLDSLWLSNIELRCSGLSCEAGPSVVMCDGGGWVGSKIIVTSCSSASFPSESVIYTELNEFLHIPSQCFLNRYGRSEDVASNNRSCAHK